MDLVFKTMLRNERDCTLRFFHHGIAWDLQRIGGLYELLGVE